MLRLLVEIGIEKYDFLRGRCRGWEDGRDGNRLAVYNKYLGGEW